MTEKTFVISKSLSARDTAFFVQTASKYDSKIQLRIGDKKINAKSIMGAISLNMSCGQEAVVCAEGDDETAAVEEISSVLR